MRQKSTLAMCLIAVALWAIGTLESSWAQKSGGTLRVYQRENPPSASIHEEATISTTFPFSPVFNNLLIFDPQVPVESVASIRPELAESWTFNEAGTRLTMRLRQGVVFHDGKPFTAKDVVCTFDLIGGKIPGPRKTPRRAWFQNIEMATADTDHQVTFHLRQPQPSLIALLASNYTPIYPCHVSAADMRAKPIGTGPFKVEEFKRDQSIRLVRNASYWKAARPYLDAIDFRIIPSRATRMLAFVAGEFDLTFVDDLTIALLKDVKSRAPSATCEYVPSGIFVHLLVNSTVAPFDNPAIRKAMALAIDRNPYGEILGEGRLAIGGTMMPSPEGLWGMPPEVLSALPGYGPDLDGRRKEARTILEGLGYTKDNPLKLKVSTRSLDVYKDPALILVDQLKHINVSAELSIIDSSVWFNLLTTKQYSIALNITGTAVDDPDVTLFENYACKSERNYSNYCSNDVEALISAQSREADNAKRKKLVWDIERKLAEDVARPVIAHLKGGTCWYPNVKGITRHVSSMYNNWRFEDVWLDK